MIHCFENGLQLLHDNLMVCKLERHTVLEVSMVSVSRRALYSSLTLSSGIDSMSLRMYVYSTDSSFGLSGFGAGIGQRSKPSSCYERNPIFLFFYFAYGTYPSCDTYLPCDHMWSPLWPIVQVTLLSLWCPLFSYVSPSSVSLIYRSLLF